MAVHRERTVGRPAPKSAQYSYKNARELVVLVVVSNYLLVIADQSQVTSAFAERDTAKVLFDQTTDQKQAGLAAAVDVLRSDVELQAREQRLIVARNNLAKQKLVLARAKVINENWPEGSQPDPLDREAMDHEAYAQSRERVYIGRQEYFDRLDTHAAANDTKPLVILGESGSGKSALLANWVARYRQAHPDALVLRHYIGATPYSADWAAMLRRLMGEFKRRLGLQQDIPDQPDALRSAFPNWLYMAAAKGRVVLVLDALNQLEDRDGAPDLVWLPPVLPENVRLIVSTLPGRPLEEIQKRHWPTLKVELLSADERRKLIAEYLAQHAKSLNAARVERIATAPPSANPLYLRVLLDELRLVRTHEELEERIGDYLKAETPYALYEKVIARWEQDYEGDSDLVGDTLSLLWAARRGLTETELLQALGKDGEPLPRAKWSPLFLAMSDALISRGGLLNFVHDFLRTAVENAYLPTEQNQQQAHLRLAEYFERQSISSRIIDELPWQLAEAGEWVRLQAHMIDRGFFKEAWERNENDVKAYWAQIENNSGLRMVAAYQSQIKMPESEDDKNHLWRLAELLGDTWKEDAQFEIRTYLVNYHRERCRSDSKQKNLDAAIVLKNFNWLAAALDNLACLLHERGELDRADELRKEAAIYRNKVWTYRPDFIPISETSQLLDASALSRASILPDLNQAAILCYKNDNDKAKALIDKVEQTCRHFRCDNYLPSILLIQSDLFYKQGMLDESIRKATEAGRLCQQLDDLWTLEKALHYQARVYRVRNDLGMAITLWKDAENLCRKLSNFEGLARALVNQASVLRLRGQAQEGLSLAEEAFRLATMHGYAALVTQIEPILDVMRQTATGENSGKGEIRQSAASACVPAPPHPEPTISELRDSAATALKRGLWEAAETYLEKLLQQGEPVETVAPDLITALLNAHETPTAAAVNRIETLLAQLESAGHTVLANDLRAKFTTKLEAGKPKKPWWKLGR